MRHIKRSKSRCACSCVNRLTRGEIGHLWLNGGELMFFSTMITLADRALALEPPAQPTKSSERFREDLETVNEQLAVMKLQWDEGRSKVLGENVPLEDAAMLLGSGHKKLQKQRKEVSEVRLRGHKHLTRS